MPSAQNGQIVFLFTTRRRHTRSKRDWSSDVCSSDLTGVCFLDDAHGVAVGHDEVILITADAGHSWKRTHFAPEAQRPLLDVWCGGGGRAIAVGAYSAYFVSQDGGESWATRNFTPAPPPATRARGESVGTEAAGGYHLNRIVSSGDSRLYIAAEA